MREYSVDLQSFLTGLSREERSRNQPGLKKCLGLRPRQVPGSDAVELVRGEEPHDPTDLTVSWPFPQIFKGHEHTLIADATAIYEVDIDKSWTRTTIASGLTRGGAWHFVDWGTFWILFNGQQFVVYNGSSATVYSTPKCQTGTNFRGRLIWGGFESDFWSSAWRSEIASWLAKESTGLSLDLEMHNNTIMWGAIGGGDFTCWITDPTSSSYPIVGPLGSGSGYDSDRPFYQDMLRRGDVGWRRTPWQGYVRRILPLGDGFVVYGDNGMSGFTPFDTGFGMVELSNEIGVLGRSSVGGRAYGQKGDFHIVLGNDGHLYGIDEQFNLTRLGYKHHLTELTSGTTVSFDETFRETYICDTHRGFVLTSQGLAELGRVPTSLCRVDRQLIGPTKVPENSTDSIELETEPFRMGSGSLKMLRLLDVGHSHIGNLQASASFRVDPNASFRALGWKRVSKTGGAFLNVMGIDFTVKVKGEPLNEQSSIEDLRARWQVGDNRNVRGLFDANTA